ncbi:futalosine hydrolase [Paenibacillus sp. N3.4]|uniref:futalosine hydrolase n=1 Tax=Paenibacillus sp. N3.4 TaxID=2603222 RepID=UPI0011CB46EA|nr:futalosine hydrolase [Paenibacillus sp. N3.4]TXK66999.1 futalosine hydrolase [Paenibacillus sp. N3.4]
MRVLVMTAVTAERDAVLRGLGEDSRFELALAGVGLAAAAVHGALALAKAEYDLVVIAGIAGGFAGQAEVGSLVVASEIIAADLGVEMLDGFKSLDELGFGSTRIAVDMELAHRLTEGLLAVGLQARSGPVLTVATATGTAATAAELAVRVPGAAAEAMEGFGIAAAAQQRGVPILEIRAISNAVGPRDRDAWRIVDALKALETASSVLAEVLK